MARKRNKARSHLYDTPAYRKVQGRIAQAVLALRKERGWTQEVAAHHCDMTPRMYQHCENGDANSTLATIARLCTGFKVDVEELFRKR